MDFRKNSRGITLIALVITIIVLLILAGVSLSLVVGGDGILGRAESAVNATDEAKAREKLEILLAGILADKYTDENYNAGNYIDEKIIENEMIVSGNVITVDGWQFEIDRSKPKIINALGKGQESEKIEILTDVQYNSTFSQATIKFTINYEGNLKSIQINGENQEILSNELTKTVDKNGTYQIYVKDENDAYKLAKAEITELAEDMEIRTPGDLVAFRDKVNKGATFEGKTVTLMNDFDLESTVWEPIGYYDGSESYLTTASQFKGIFEGNGYSITINSVSTDTKYKSMGIFGLVNGGTIQNLTSKGTIDSKTGITGGIAGLLNYGTVINCSNYGTINSTATRVGGIVGANGNNSLIDSCYNIGKITSTGKDSSSHSLTGGIAGSNYSDSIIQNVYNIGNVTVQYPYIGGIVGYNGNSSQPAKLVENVYNAGTIMKETVEASSNIGTASNYVGYLIGRYGSLSGYYANVTKDALKGLSEDEIKKNLGENFTKDTNNINNGYPILRWQVGK